MFTFKRGASLSTKKELTKNLKIEALPAPEIVFLPLVKDAEDPYRLLVKEKDIVKKGQHIAAFGKMETNVHASVSGEVLGIAYRVNFLGRKVPHVKIKNDNKNTEVFMPALTDNCSSEDIIKRVKEAGIMGMGGAAFPTYVKLSPPEGKKAEILIINGCECEPYLNCDYRVMKERAKEFVEGCLLLQKALNANSAVVAIEEHNKDIADLLKSQGIIEVAVVKAKYPQGAEKMLIYALTKRKVTAGKLPIDIGIVVSNVQTAYAVYEAVKRGKPSIERVITVSGGAIANPKNLLVPAGTPINEVAKFCGGYKTPPKRIVIGGPMMGYAEYSLDAVMSKRTSGVLFLTNEEINTNKMTACINCARCARSCPMKLMPMHIESGYLSGDFAAAKKYGALHCMECGACAYACPANRPLVQSIKISKKMIKEKKL
ncbi:MAG: electron transport complex subunit RsxC [Firmicutes bacterium]|nr:electron transport complex subunit RsxC [Bacillota bacterium]